MGTVGLELGPTLLAFQVFLEWNGVCVFAACILRCNLGTWWTFHHCHWPRVWKLTAQPVFVHEYLELRSQQCQVNSEL